jgi:glycosyltransferase involved in cell wall biosynthesis
MINRVRRWDLATSRRPTVYLANSSTSAKRIARCYGLPSEIVYPPVDVSRFQVATETGDYHLVVSRLVGYKRIDLAVRTFTQLGRRLVVIGDGPARAGLEAMAGPTIEFLGRLSDQEAGEYYRHCQALIFPGEEDFGLTPLESNASGRPVIAYAAGGALDTVIDGETGVFFRAQDPDSLANAVARCETIVWDQKRLREHSESFGEDVFRLRMATAIASAARQKLGPLLHANNQGGISDLEIQ